jgi:hypothetical protein
MFDERLQGFSIIQTNLVTLCVEKAIPCISTNSYLLCLLIIRSVTISLLATNHQKCGMIVKSVLLCFDIFGFEVI